MSACSHGHLQEKGAAGEYEKTAGELLAVQGAIMTVYSGDRNNHNHIGKAAKNRNHPVSPQPSAIAGW